MNDVKEILFRCGKQVFSEKGFKRTTVADITNQAGIAVGSFYKYYPSKDQLFLEIYLHENEQLKKSFADAPLADDPVCAILTILKQNEQGIQTNPILKEWYNKDLYSKFEKTFHAQGGMRSIEKQMNESTRKLIQMWKSSGKLRTDLDDDLILALLHAIPYIDIHKEEIGIQYFPDLTYLLTEFVMRGLTDIHPKSESK